MMTTIFNSTFENTLRLSILMDVFKTPQNEDMLFVIDFIAQYGAMFNVSDENLHGENMFMFSEFATRKAVVRLALKDMVLEGYVKPLQSSNGIAYKLSGDGRAFCSELDSEYANDYRRLVNIAIKKYADKSERQIISEINKLSNSISKKEDEK